MLLYILICLRWVKKNPPLFSTKPIGFLTYFCIFYINFASFLEMSKKCYCKVYNLTCKGNFNIKYSNTIKGKTPVWKITGKTFVSSVKNTETAGEDIKKIMSVLRQKITRNLISSSFDSNMIFDYDFIKYINSPFKNKMLSFDLFLKQKSQKGNVKEEFINILETPIEELSETFLKTNLKLTNARQ